MFTSEEFDEVGRTVRYCIEAGHGVSVEYADENGATHHGRIIEAALKVASRVMRPGVIKKASEDYFEQCLMFDYADEAEAICKALTE